LQVHWLRIIIDEGHSLGASLGLTNKLAMAVQLRAARRWVMTGTPTPATAAGNMNHLAGFTLFVACLCFA
jgi:SNF2 family DNA or RNA helicase